MTNDERADKQFLARITGRVHGVGFRFFVQAEAKRLGIHGWVRNLDGGDVEMLARGPEPDLKDLLGRVRQGPPLAWVQRVHVDWRQPDHSAPRFDIKTTGW